MDKTLLTSVSETTHGQIEETSDTAISKLPHESEKAIVQSSNVADITTIAELRPNSYNKVIEVRVCRKWISVTYSKKKETGFSPKKKENAYCSILIDKEVW